MALPELRTPFSDYPGPSDSEQTEVSTEPIVELESFISEGSTPRPRAPEPEGQVLKSVTILIPALNEEDGIVRVIGNLPLEELRRRGFDPTVLLVDGNSTDRTRDYAEALGADVFVQKERGKGAALREVIPTLTTEYAVMIDGDGTYPVDAIPDFVDALDEGRDVISGSRLAGEMEAQAMPGLHKIGNRLLTGLANTLYPLLKTTDMCTGLWGFRVSALKTLRLTANGFDLEADLFSETALQGFRYAEVPIRYGRRSGTSKLSWRNGAGIAWTLMKKRATRRSVSRETPDLDATDA